MKKLMKLFVLVAAAAMTLASCQKNEFDAPIKKEVHFTINAGISQTKTYITDNGDKTYTPSWHNGDKLGVLFSLNEGSNVVEFENTAEDGGTVGMFNGKYTFEANDEGIVEGNMYAFYPSESFKKFYDNGEVRLDLKASQNPTSTSFDPACDLMIAKPCYYIAEATGADAEVEIDNMYFARMMSVLRVNLKSDFLSNEKVKTLKFTATDVDLVGAMRFNLAEGTFEGNQSSSGVSDVIAQYAETDPIYVGDENNSAFLVVAPVTIPAETTLTFTIETENYNIVKTFSAPSQVMMPEGNVAVINLNIKQDECAAKTEDTSDYSGTYAILTKRSSGGYYYMTNDLGSASTKRFTAEEAGEALPEEGVSLGASKLWQITKSGEYYTVQSVGTKKYINWPGGNSASLAEEGVLFTITHTDGLYNLSYAATDETRYLSLNNTTGNNYFALYKSGQAKDLALIPAVQGEEPATLTATAPSQMSAEAGNGSFAYELKNPKDDIQLTATTEATWITELTVGDGQITYTVEANESEEAREAVIILTYGDLTTSVTITQAGKHAEGGEAEATTWSWAGGSSADFKNLANVTTNGLGSDYAASNAPYNIKLDTTGDYFTVKVDGTIQNVTVGVKMLGGANTSYLDVQGSVDGTSYTSVEKLTISGAQNNILNLVTTKQFDSSYRYLKFHFTKGSNIGVGPISITYIPGEGDGNEGGETTDPVYPDTPTPSANTYTIYTGALVEGDYIIVYQNGAMKASVSSNRLSYSEVSPVDNKISDPDGAIVWHIAPSGNDWTIYNADVEKYAAANGTKNQAALNASATDDKSLWTVSGTSTYEFVNKYNKSKSVNSNLRRNGTYGFACYSTSTGGALTLYKKN